MNDFIKQAGLYIEEKNLLDTECGFRVVAGVSGGADSVCLLLVLKELAEKSNSMVAAVHVNHNLRGASADADQEFVRSLCKRLDVELFEYSEDVSGYAESHRLTLEEAGRKIRYERFAEIAKHLDAKIAVAHHMDDNAETIIFNLLRGTDLNGLAGIKPETQINGCRVIRPLLFATRDQIEEFLNSRHQDYCEDHTNSDTEFSRNRIRHNIINEMKAINPAAVKHICRTAALAGMADDALKDLSDELFNNASELIYGDGGQSPVRISLDIEKLAGSDEQCLAGNFQDKEKKTGSDELILNNVVYKAIITLNGTAKDVSNTHVSDTAGLLKLKNGSRINLPGGITAVRENDRLVLKKTENSDGWEYLKSRNIEIKLPELFGINCLEDNKHPEKVDEKCLEDDKHPEQTGSEMDCYPDAGVSKFTEIILPTGEKFSFEIIPVDLENKEQLIEKNKYTKAFDYDKIKGSLFITTRQPEDKINTGGCLRNVNRFLISQKVPRDERDNILILRDEEKVIWIIGHRISDECKITDSTKTVLKVTVSGLTE